MVRITFALFAALTSSVLAFPSPLSPDPSGAKNVGNGNGQQFITGACLSDADCQSGCCAVLGNGGICSGPDVSTAQGKQGCGFGGAGAGAGAAPAASSSVPAVPSASPTPAAAAGGSAAGVDTSAPGSADVGTGNGQQFITGQCFSDADCASACCSAGACAAEAVANEAGGAGCGFTN